ncbi:MAG: sel1 repeat family protein [Neisseriaceae bacterium]|nr:sel1 repeat family protein [Neisseriaceae bacterium]
MKKSLSLLILTTLVGLTACQSDSKARISKNVDFSQHILAENTLEDKYIESQIEKFQSQFANKEELFAAVRKLCDEKHDDIACFKVVNVSNDIEIEFIEKNIANKDKPFEGNRVEHPSFLSQQDKLKYAQKALDLSNEYCQMGRKISCELIPETYPEVFDATENKNSPKLAQAMNDSLKALQTACLSQTTPNSCNNLKELYTDTKRLVGENDEYIQLYNKAADAEGEEREKLKQEVMAMSEKLCAKDHPVACFWLGSLLAEKGESVKARQLYQKSCDLGIGNGCWEIAAAFRGSNKTKKIITNYEQACKLGYWEGGIEPCAYAYYAYQCGLGVEKNHAKAKEYFTPACKRGYWHDADSDKCEEEYTKMPLDDKACEEMLKENKDASAEYKKALNEVEEYIQKGNIPLGSATDDSFVNFAKTKTYQELNKNEQDIIHNYRDVTKAQLDGDMKKAQKVAENLCQTTNEVSMCSMAGLYLLPDWDFELMVPDEVKTTPTPDPKKGISILTQSCDKDEFMSFSACTFLSSIYQDGKYGVAKDEAKAEALHQKAMELMEKKANEKKDSEKDKKD